MQMRGEHEQNRNTPTRPGKLPPRRRSPTPTGSASFNPMEGASEATAARLANFLKFVPTPVFKPPRKNLPTFHAMFIFIPPCSSSSSDFSGTSSCIESAQTNNPHQFFPLVCKHASTLSNNYLN
ncbi:hypothetical protein Ahy_A07g031252 [Arachis hypogaea]|uniref:Uncharacterized protein n=1 Tax=Arachis hypogaea TaxID=3818 RepID=A0A445C3C0_ARAHY|nr:hypothetical protein Ahy_A07g031252 [Arachis hypogaea]